MLETGILSPDEPLELIDGELVVMSPQGPVHSSLSSLVHDLLAATYGDDVHLRTHSPIDGGTRSLPEPDIAVIVGEQRSFFDHQPSAADLLMVVEVSVTSAEADRAKAAVYARAGVKVYWQIDVNARRLIVQSEPDDGWYRVVHTYDDRDSVCPPEGHTPIAVAELLP